MRLLRDIDEKLFVELLEQIFQLLPTRIDHLLLLWKKSTIRLEIFLKSLNYSSKYLPSTCYLPVASGWLVVFELGKLELVGTARSSEGSAALEVFEQTDWTRHRLGR